MARHGPLSEERPDIAAQWHPTKNGPLSPSDVTAGSTKKVWWKCDSGPDHEWQVTVSYRSRGYGCPMCAAPSAAASVTNSLASLRPDIAAQWHPTKNGDLTPDKVRPTSNKRAWWVCDKGPDHEWRAPVTERTTGHGCSMCAGKSVSVTNSLAAQFPQVAAQWHPTRNGDLTPDKVVAGSHKKRWWVCHEGPDHEWDATVLSRTSGAGCSMCASQSVSVTNSLMTRFPEVAAEWHPTRNGDLTPAKVVAGAKKQVWWTCRQGPDHEWQAVVSNRTSNGTGCPMCAGKSASVTNSLAALYPAVAAQWHPTKNGELTPDMVVAGAHSKVWWICDLGHDHEWRAPVETRTAGHGCPMCSGLSVSVTNSLAALHPAVAAEWHPTKNGELTPDLLVARSNKRVWWICEEGPDHMWQAGADSRARGRGCPMCAGQSVSVTNSLAALYPAVATQWHPTKNGDLTPDQVVAGSNKKLWWICHKGPDHEWQAPPGDRIAGHGCSMCAGRSASVTNSLAAHYPAVAAQLHPTKNGDLTADLVVAGSHAKIWWTCPVDPLHVWRAVVGNRTSNGTGCPDCSVRPRSLIEVRIAYEVAALTPLDPEDHRIKTGRWNIDCDIIVRGQSLVVEYDGSYWHKRGASRDARKTKRLNDAGWRVVRIREQPLEPVTDLDVRVPLGSSPKDVVDLLLPRLVELGLVSSKDAGVYLSRTDLVAGDDSLEAVRAIQAQRQARAAP